MRSCYEDLIWEPWSILLILEGLGLLLVLNFHLFPIAPLFLWDLATVATYPLAGGRREIRGMRVPRKEYVRSRHQRLFEENVGNNGKDAIYELLSKRFGSCICARGRY